MINTSNIVKLLMIDYQPSGDDFIDDPTWEDIERALHLMEGRYRTYLGLYKADEPTEDDFLMVGGGLNGNYVCSYYTGQNEYYIINEMETDPHTVIDVPIGQMNAKQKKYCNNLTHIIPAVKHFYKTGAMSPVVKWAAV